MPKATSERRPHQLTTPYAAMLVAAIEGGLPAEAALALIGFDRKVGAKRILRALARGLLNGVPHADRLGSPATG